MQEEFYVVLKEIIDKQFEDVKQCHVKFLPETVGIFPRQLDSDRKKFRVNFIREETTELDDATNIDDEIDACVDIVYVALGMLVEMGVPPDIAFDIVHRKNMLKQRGAKSTRPGSKGIDMIKPPGWTPPDYTEMLAQLRLQASVSPVLLHVTKIRQERGAKYNAGGVTIQEHFPLGDESYFQMCWTKTVRMKALILSKIKGETLLDSILDTINYLCFWAESLMKGEKA